MFAINTFWIFYLAFMPGFHFLNVTERFLHKNVLRKCCEQGEVLVFDDGPPFECEEHLNRTTYILTQRISNFTTNRFKEIQCVDSVKDDERSFIEFPSVELKTCLDMNCFPKCCPVNSAYDPVEHKCINVKSGCHTIADVSFNSPNEGFFAIKIGLTDCTAVIVDYKLSSLDDVFDKDNGVFVKRLNESIYCFDNICNSSDYVVRVCHPDFSICKNNSNDSKSKLKCVRKCCPDGTMYKTDSVCAYDFEHGLSFANDSRIDNWDDKFAIIVQPFEGVVSYLADPEYRLDSRGVIYEIIGNKTIVHSPFETSGYCFEEVGYGKYQGMQLFMLAPATKEDRENIEYEISRVVLSLSCIFCALTIVGYLIVPEMLNLHGWILMCYCSTMLISHLSLVGLQFNPTIIDEDSCRSAGYFLLYTILSTFMWSNVMCFDIWRTFVSLKVRGLNKKRAHLKRFIFYSIYAWKTPLFIVVLARLLEHFQKHIPDVLKPIVPQIGQFKCFFETKTNFKAYFAWFILPITIICVCNLVLFVKTIAYCYKVKTDLEKMKNIDSKDFRKTLAVYMERLRTIVKLFLVMGITWIFESIEAYTVPDKVEGIEKVLEIIVDSFNSLQGVFIFIIFILNKNFIRAFKKEHGFTHSRTPLQTTTTT